MDLLNKAKNALSNIGEETIAEASFEKDEAPKPEKPQRAKRPKVKNPVAAKKEKKPKVTRQKKEEEYIEVEDAVEDTKFDTFRDAKKIGRAHV